MGYDLDPTNKKLDWFHFGAFSFPILLEAAGYLWPCIHKHGRYYCVFGMDERMGSEYPRIITNDGFRVTAEEARMLARIARNYVAIQRSLPEPDESEKDTFFLPAAMQPWPSKIRADFVDKFEAFADWADQSSGFRIF